MQKKTQMQILLLQITEKIQGEEDPGAETFEAMSPDMRMIAMSGFLFVMQTTFAKT